MDAPESVIALVRDWLRKADNDLANAAHTLKLGVACPTDTVCFHAQQCVEKHLKALLVFLEIPFPRTHDIGHLVSMVPPALAPSLNADQHDLLTDYDGKYPERGNPKTRPISKTLHLKQAAATGTRHWRHRARGR